jgi:copper chaperone CopZ
VKPDEVNDGVGELVVRTTKLRVQNMCCPKEAQIVHEELRKLEVRIIIIEL